MSRKSQVVSIVAIVIFALFLTGNFPQFSKDKKCDSSSIRELAKSEEQICVKVGDTYKFVDVFMLNDLYAISDFCLKVASATVTGRAPNCSFFEDEARMIVNERFPKDFCIEFLRNYIFTVVEISRDIRYYSEVEAEKATKSWASVAKISSGCYPLLSLEP
jgi:hypothetical protein